MPPNPDAYAALRDAVMSFELLPGERLSERGLEPLIGASRTPIRAALVRLENEGLTRREGRGWQVAPIDLTEVRAVMEYREAVETAAVRLACDRADAEELRAIAAMLSSTGDTASTGLQVGEDFHVALARLSRNPFLVDGVRTAMTRLARTRWLEVRTAESRANARAEHRDILAAVEDGDADRAADLVSAHARGTRDRLLGFLAEERRRLRGRGMAIVDSDEAPPA